MLIDIGWKFEMRKSNYWVSYSRVVYLGNIDLKMYSIWWGEKCLLIRYIYYLFINWWLERDMYIVSYI